MAFVLRLLSSVLPGCLLSVALLGCSEKKVEVADTRPLVRVGCVTNGVAFADTLRVQGTVRTRHSAKVAARVPGTIDALLVDEGDFVKAGTPMFRVDQVNLANAVRAAKDDLAMAKAKLAQSEATDAKAALDLTRMQRLLNDGAVTRDAFEKSEVAAKSYGATLAAARATLAKAETGLAVAEKNFADSEVRAPFDGIVTKKYANAGDYVGGGKSVFGMDDTSVYELCLSLNAALYSRVTTNQTALVLRPPASEIKQSNNQTIKQSNNQTIKQSNNQTIKQSLTLPLTYKSTIVDPLTRTFEIRAVVPKSDALAPGMIVACDVCFARRTSQAVPASAVALRGGSDTLFKVVDGKVVRMPVTAGVTADGLREILSPTLAPDDALIVEGMLLVNEGDEVRVKK